MDDAAPRKALCPAYTQRLLGPVEELLPLLGLRADESIINALQGMHPEVLRDIGDEEVIQQLRAWVRLPAAPSS